MANQFYVHYNVEDNLQSEDCKTEEVKKRFARMGSNSIGILNARDGKQYETFLYEGLLIGIGEGQLGTIYDSTANKSLKKRFKKIKNLTGIFFS